MYIDNYFKNFTLGRRPSRASLILRVLIAAGLLGLAYTDAISAPNPKERIEYWRSNFKELTAADDPRVSRAFSIFNRLRKVAGVGGVNPKLLILAEDPYNISLPIAIRDKWVILSKRVLDISYQDNATGDDKLAFILGHEISHLLYNSFIHVDLFTTLSKIETDDKESNKAIEELRALVNNPENFAYKELEADEKGIIFAAMAGFDTSVIVNADGSDSFFRQWQRAQDISRFVKVDNAVSHPVVALRETKILQQLRNIENRAQLYNLGMMYYRAGSFLKAAQHFEQFLQYFASREVYHNLATSYHQLALLEYLDDNDAEFPFKFTLIADPTSRAVGLSSKRHTKKTTGFSFYIDKAISNYQRAIELDQDYHYSVANLGAAYLINNEPYKSIALLKDAQQQWPENAIIKNALGVAFFYIEKYDAATRILSKASQISPKFLAPLYNLGKIAYLRGQKDKAQQFWSAYLQQDNDSYWALLIRNKYGIGEPKVAKRGLPSLDFEEVNGVHIADFKNEIPRTWRNSALYELNNTKNSIIRFDNGIDTILESDAIRLIRVSKQYRGVSKRGIKIGDGAGPVKSAYGNPAMTIKTTAGDSWVYPSNGISFQIKDNKVISWLIY
ncbi:MAG: tetratricopeptide repeat protein [Thiohalomonadales bacterium]